MRFLQNRFGTGEVYEIGEVKKPIFATSSACMSVYSDFLSWANTQPMATFHNRHVANSIIVLSCQVTDLAILNDLWTLEKYNRCKNVDLYIGGCLAYRFDIPLPAKRLLRTCCDYQPIVHTSSLVYFEKPFWVPNFDEGGWSRPPDSLLSTCKPKSGHLFRRHYPLRIGVGCSKSCSYCTINATRGDAYELDTSRLVNEFVNARDPVLLIADSPSAKQLLEWIEVAKSQKKSISIRNVEPQVARKIWNELLELSEMKLLHTFHCPVQANSELVLRDMGRNVDDTFYIINHVDEFHPSTFTATNIIVDYKNFSNQHVDKVYQMFDYVSWNPFWDGVWDRDVAERRYRRYFGT